MDVCLRVLKESNKSRLDSYSVKKQWIIDHIPYYLSGLSRAHFSDSLSGNICNEQTSRAGDTPPLMHDRTHRPRSFNATAPTT